MGKMTAFTADDIKSLNLSTTGKKLNDLLLTFRNTSVYSYPVLKLLKSDKQKQQLIDEIENGKMQELAINSPFAPSDWVLLRAEQISEKNSEV